MAFGLLMYNRTHMDVSDSGMCTYNVWWAVSTQNITLEIRAMCKDSWNKSLKRKSVQAVSFCMKHGRNYCGEGEGGITFHSGRSVIKAQIFKFWGEKK